MAEQPRKDDKLIDKPRPGETSDVERERIRSSNDRDQSAEREGESAPHNRGYDRAARGQSIEPIDPDSAASEIDRDEEGQ